MFERIGKLNERWWYGILAAWAVALVFSSGLLSGWLNGLNVLPWRLPAWRELVQDGEFSYLPEKMQSLVGESLLSTAFPRDLLKSSAVVIVRRESQASDLVPQDYEFIENTLKPDFQSIADEPNSLISSVKTSSDPLVGQLLDSSDKRASLIIIALKTEFLFEANGKTIRKIEKVLEETETGRHDGLDVSLRRYAKETLAVLPRQLLRKSAVVAIRAEGENAKLTEQDVAYIDKTLKPALQAIADAPSSNIVPKDFVNAKTLTSADNRAALILVEFQENFLDEANVQSIRKIEKLLNDTADQRSAGVAMGVGAALLEIRPVGLDIAISGSATVGRDMIAAATQSADATERWTMILVVALLLIIYRAPLLAIIPLMTVAVSVHVAMALVALLTHWGFMGFRVFNGLEVYIMVVVYGTGVDYCLFLIARYKEEIDNGAKWRQAISLSLSKVGAALTASALTVICGIGMMFFAKFGKFREAGVFISISLCVGLLASMTLTPALLRAAGHLAFWPYGRSRKLPEVGGWISGTTLFSRLFDGQRIHQLWERTGQALLRIPGTAWLTCVICMFPFAIVGVWFHDYLSYGLLSELRPTTKSVVGAKAVQAHFPAGYAGPMTVILKNDKLNFAEETGEQILTQILTRLEEQKVALRIDDLRSLQHPLGTKPRPDVPEEGPIAARLLRKSAEHRKSLEYYVSSVPGLEGKVTRFDVIFQDDPFSRESIEQLTAVEKVVRDSLPADFFEAGSMNLVGPTASIRDLKTVTDGDQIRIDSLVLFSVFTILVVLLRKPAISLYLIMTVFFSYFVTLGVTVVAFWWLDPKEFAGLDWKVPIYLFTILIAIGEDYNIFLMTRIEEEQLVHGPVEGIRIAVQRTGSIISSCGIIMAGTFCSLMAGTLVGMQQLGFALAFGVLLDTFVVRPVLVPAYLVMLHSGQFGRFGRLLGNRFPVEPQKAPLKTSEPSLSRTA